MEKPLPSLFLLRLCGEVTTKSRRVRSRFQRMLMENLKDALQRDGIWNYVYHDWSRVFVEAEHRLALAPISRVFGVHSISEIEQTCPPTMADIVRVGAEFYAERVRGRKYAVRARRSGVEGFCAMDVNVQLGRALNDFAQVDLKRPDITVHVEIRPDRAMFFSDHAPGAGGLPLGSQGKAVALISGGFDSAVAAWMLLRRGVDLDYVLCNLAGAAYERTVLGVAKVLADSWSYGTRPRMHVIDFQPVVAALRRDVQHKYAQVVLKRLMYRAGVRVAEEIGGEAVITGEAVGQVSSQTLTNLRAIDEVASLPVLRPLVGMDKEEIIAHTRRLGTYALSASVQEYCAVTRERPVTAAKPFAVRAEEANLDLALLDPLIAQRRVIDLRGLTDSDLVMPYLHTDQVAEGAVVIDCREQRFYEAWHYPDALHMELEELLDGFRALDKSKSYVLYCPIGLQSAVAAERMQRAGYEAYSFKGGSAALRRLAEGE